MKKSIVLVGIMLLIMLIMLAGCRILDGNLLPNIYGGGELPIDPDLIKLFEPVRMSNDVTNVKEEDFGSEPDPGEVEIGDTFTGPSGTEYELQEENLGAEELAYYDEIGISADGIWVEVNKRMWK